MRRLQETEEELAQADALSQQAEGGIVVSQAGLILEDHDITRDSQEVLSKATPPKYRHRHDSTVLCRFISGKVTREDADFRQVSYIAFSHVWGKPSSYVWTTTDLIPYPIKVTPAKARFLEENLLEIVGDNYFWLDVLCIDQSPEGLDERIQATAIMPEIYRRATKTVVIRDGLGFQRCCAEAVGRLGVWAEYTPGFDRWGEHCQKQHREHRLYEGVLERLWPLQEMVLSDRLQFVSCKENLSEWGEGDWSLYDDPGGFSQSILANVDRLWTTSRAWASHGTTSGEGVPIDEQLSFVNAFLHNGEVTRKRTGRLAYSDAIGKEFLIQSNSTRRTTEARDLILSTMSQYGWFSAPSPQKIREMKFGELFRDCFEQARRADRAVLPKVTGGMVGDAGWKLETSNIPEPECLGDLVKLFGLATRGAPTHGRDCAYGFNLGKIKISRAKPPDMEAAFDIIQRSLEFSRQAWRLATSGEFSAFGALPDSKLFSEEVTEGECLEQAKSFLNLFVLGHFNGGYVELTADSFKRDLIRANPPNYVDVMIRITALVGCGIGVSAFEWSKNIWTPVLVPIGEHEILGLISSADLELAEASPVATRHEHHLATPVELSTCVAVGEHDILGLISSPDLELEEGSPPATGNEYLLAAPVDLSTRLRIDYKYVVISSCLANQSGLQRCIGLLPDFTVGLYPEVPSPVEAQERYLKRLKELGLKAFTKGFKGAALTYVSLC